MAVTEHRPATREAWLDLRRHDVTASQAGGLIPGVHPRLTPYQLFMIKTGRLPDELDDTPAMRRGRKLEPIAAEFVAEHFPGARIEYNVELAYWRDADARLGATPDLIVIDPNRGRGAVQLKSIEPSIYKSKWIGGEPPLWVALQATVEAKLTGAAWAAVGALRVGFGIDFDLVPIPLHDGAWSRLKAEAAAFWRAVALDQPPPPDFEHDGEAIAALNLALDPNGSIDLSHDRELVGAVAERERLKRASKDFARRCDHLEALIRHKAGDHELVLAGDYRVSLKRQEVAGYTVQPSTRRPMLIRQIREPDT